jgi:ribosomal protein S6--L-glutamate ligase
MSGRTLVDPEEKYVLGQPSIENLKELYKNASAKKTGLRIGLLASNPSLYSNRRIMEAGEARGHEMHFEH